MQLSEMNENNHDVSLAVLMNELGHIRRNSEDTKKSFDRFSETMKQTLDKIKEDYATKKEVEGMVQAIHAEVKPLKNIVYGAISTILLAFLSGLIMLVMR